MSSYDPRERLRSMFPREPGRYKLSDNDAIATMVFTRELLEATLTKDRFTVINLFCNWTVHTELEGSTPAYRLLARVTDIFLKTDDPDTRAHLISEHFSSAQLRQEFIGLYSENEVPTLIFESAAGWVMFAGHLFKAILDKPLTFPPNPATHARAGAIYTEMIETAGLRLSEVALTLRLRTGYRGKPTRIYWLVDCADGSQIEGPYRNLERDPDFSNESFWEGTVAMIRGPSD